MSVSGGTSEVAPAGRAARYPATPWSAAGLYRPFVIAALVVAASGFPLGMGVLLAATTGNLTETHLALVEVHGAAQLLGWCGLFVIGIASHVVPRFQGNVAIPFPWPQRATLTLIIAGLVLRGVAQPWGALPLRPLILVAAATAVAAGLSLFAATMAVVLVRGQSDRRRVEHWLWLGVIGSGATAAVYVLLAARSQHQLLTIPHWNHAFHAMAVYGLLLPFVFAVSGRAVAGLLALRARNPVCDRAAAFLMSVGLALLLLGPHPSAEPSLRAAAEFTTAGAMVLFTIGLRVLEPSESDRPAADRRHWWFSWYVRSAFAWLLIAATLRAASALEALGVPPAPFAGTPELHVLGIGFFTPLIIGVSARLLPLFEGRRLEWGAMLVPALVLLQVATALRLIGAIDEAPSYLTSLSGLAGLAGFALGVLPLARLLASRPALSGGQVHL